MSGLFKSKKSVNYLDKIPVRSDKIRWEQEADAKIALLIDHNGLFDKAAQKLLKKPAVSYIHLDDFGSLIWSNIDGVLTVSDLADIVHTAYGEKAEPLYPRIATYFKMLDNYGFITFVK